MKRFRSGSVFNLGSVGKVFDATLLVLTSSDDTVVASVAESPA
jgi:hypothetical protein